MSDSTADLTAPNVVHEEGEIVTSPAKAAKDELVNISDGEDPLVMEKNGAAKKNGGDVVTLADAIKDGEKSDGAEDEVAGIPYKGPKTPEGPAPDEELVAKGPRTPEEPAPELVRKGPHTPPGEPIDAVEHAAPAVRVEDIIEGAAQHFEQEDRLQNHVEENAEAADGLAAIAALDDEEGQDETEEDMAPSAKKAKTDE